MSTPSSLPTRRDPLPLTAAAGPMDLLTIAKTAADRVEAASVASKVPVAVCVVDIHGNVVLQHRMTGAVRAQSLYVRPRQDADG